MKDLEIKVVDPDGKESGGFVGNAYDHYKSAPEHKAEIIQKYVAGFSESLTVAGCQIDTSRIVPILKDRAWIDGVNAGLRAAGMEKSFENIHDAY